jgi:hypothetical protein
MKEIIYLIFQIIIEDVIYSNLRNYMRILFKRNYLDIKAIKKKSRVKSIVLIEKIMRLYYEIILGVILVFLSMGASTVIDIHYYWKFYEYKDYLKFYFLVIAIVSSFGIAFKIFEASRMRRDIYKIIK